MFVCLWSPAWQTVADSLAELSPALLTVAPRVVTEERRGGLVWVDARGLDAEQMARSAVEVVRGLGLSNLRAGIGPVAITAELMAVTGAASLGDLPIAVLEPDPALAILLDGIGVETCGELAALEGESVEVRLGVDGVRLWKLARGDDDRLIFTPMPRELPHASLEWSDYALTDTERLLFSVNALLGTVCERLVERGSLAREMRLELGLANGATLTNAVRAGRATASRKTWLRLARTALERMVLPAGVVGLTLQAATVVTDVGQQGDLFDRGFATAAATEAALASLSEEQGDVVVVPANTAHPLVERRTTWVGTATVDDALATTQRRGRTSSRSRPPLALSVPESAAPNDSAGEPVSAAASTPEQGADSMPSLVAESPAPRSSSGLTLYLLPTPRAVETRTEERRDHVLPTGYRDGGAWYGILSAAGPDRVSGDRWGEAYAREYFRCIVDDGGMVWLYHDARSDGWYLHGWWD